MYVGHFTHMLYVRTNIRVYVTQRFIYVTQRFIHVTQRFIYVTQRFIHVTQRFIHVTQRFVCTYRICVTWLAHMYTATLCNTLQHTAMHMCIGTWLAHMYVTWSTHLYLLYMYVTWLLHMHVRICVWHASHTRTFVSAIYACDVTHTYICDVTHTYVQIYKCMWRDVYIRLFIYVCDGPRAYARVCIRYICMWRDSHMYICYNHRNKCT